MHVLVELYNAMQGLRSWEKKVQVTPELHLYISGSGQYVRMDYHDDSFISISIGGTCTEKYRICKRNRTYYGEPMLDSYSVDMSFGNGKCYEFTHRIIEHATMNEEIIQYDFSTEEKRFQHSLIYDPIYGETVDLYNEIEEHMQGAYLGYKLGMNFEPYRVGIAELIRIKRQMSK